MENIYLSKSLINIASTFMQHTKHGACSNKIEDQIYAENGSLYICDGYKLLQITDINYMVTDNSEYFKITPIIDYKFIKKYMKNCVIKYSQYEFNAIFQDKIVATQRALTSYPQIHDILKKAHIENTITCKLDLKHTTQTIKNYIKILKDDNTKKKLLNEPTRNIDQVYIKLHTVNPSKQLVFTFQHKDQPIENLWFSTGVIMNTDMEIGLNMYRLLDCLETMQKITPKNNNITFTAKNKNSPITITNNIDSEILLMPVRID